MTTTAFSIQGLRAAWTHHGILMFSAFLSNLLPVISNNIVVFLIPAEYKAIIFIEKRC